MILGDAGPRGKPSHARNIEGESKEMDILGRTTMM